MNFLHNIKNLLSLSGFIFIFLIVLNAIAIADVYDDFNDNTINTAKWAADAELYTAVDEDGGALQLSILPQAAGESFNSSLDSNCVIYGYFDIQVDFLLLSWPQKNGVRSALSIKTQNSFLNIERSAWGPEPDRPDTEYYVMNGNSIIKGYTPTGDLAGKLRLQRIGNVITGFVYNEVSGWEELASYQMNELDMMPTEPVYFQLSTWSHDEYFSPDGQTITVAFDNISVVSEDLYCPSMPDEPFAYSVDYFKIQGNVPGGGLTDEFDDGLLWEYVEGNVLESGGFLRLQDPGKIDVFSAEDYFIVEQTSCISTADIGFAIQDTQGDFMAETKWTAPQLGLNNVICHSLEIMDTYGLEENSKEIEVGIYYFGPVISTVFGVSEGLNVYFLYEDESTGVFQIQTIPIDPTDIIGNVIFELHFGDDTNEITAAYSLDDGTTPSKIIGTPMSIDLDHTVFGSWTVEAVAYHQQRICQDIFDFDGDIDGRDLSIYLDDNKGMSVSEFAAVFGQSHCQ
jgi:hypothetical protein